MIALLLSREAVYKAEVFLVSMVLPEWMVISLLDVLVVKSLVMDGLAVERKLKEMMEMGMRMRYGLRSVWWGTSWKLG